MNLSSSDAMRVRPVATRSPDAVMVTRTAAGPHVHEDALAAARPLGVIKQKTMMVKEDHEAAEGEDEEVPVEAGSSIKEASEEFKEYFQVSDGSGSSSSSSSSTDYATRTT